MANIYRSTDSGAPALPSGSPQQNRGKYLMDVIKACLVDGFGTNPAAGWTLDYQDTTTDKYRMAISNGNGVVEFVTWGGYGVGMFIWDSITTPGTGRLNDDPYNDVVSEGVNGWKHEQSPVPGVDSEYCMGVNCAALYDINSSTLDWTVYADDKSAWILFHYPDGHSSAEPGDTVSSAADNSHPQLFFGALKSPDLARGDQGNLFIGYGNLGFPATSGEPTSGNTKAINYFWGLRTPTGDLPSSANGSDFNIYEWDANTYAGNPFSSMRVIIPAIVFYQGTDTYRPASMSSAYAHYGFASLPGVGQFAPEAQGVEDFWAYYTAEFSSTWNLEKHTFGGIEWMPWALGSSTSDKSQYGITDDSGWWA